MNEAAADWIVSIKLSYYSHILKLAQPHVTTMHITIFALVDRQNIACLGEINIDCIVVMLQHGCESAIIQL